MWLFTQNGFFSIVAHRDEPEILIVRARVRGDIERYWPRQKVFMTPGFDYLYRAFIPKEVVAKTIGKIVLDVDYADYKGNIADKRRGPWYSSVWNARHSPALRHRRIGSARVPQEEESSFKCVVVFQGERRLGPGQCRLCENSVERCERAIKEANILP